MFKTRREALCWAAGFFDGEGCFYAHYNKPRKDGTRRMQARANLVQNDRSLLEKFQEVMGFGHIGQPSKNGTSTWTVSKNGEAEKIAELLGEWLSDRRLDRCRELIEEEAHQDDKRQNKIRKQVTCHPERIHKALGMCGPCYQRHSKENKKED